MSVEASQAVKHGLSERVLVDPRFRTQPCGHTTKRCSGRMSHVRRARGFITRWRSGNRGLRSRRASLRMLATTWSSGSRRARRLPRLNKNGEPWVWQSRNCWDFACHVKRELFGRELPRVAVPADLSKPGSWNRSTGIPSVARGASCDGPPAEPDFLMHRN
jgi:hypothetical protein